MGQIRHLERPDLPAVAGLYERVMRSGSHAAPAGLASFFERTLISQPWSDPEIPSLVYEGDAGELLGFLGSHVRRLSLDGRPLRLGCSGPLVIDSAARSQALGMLMVRQYLSGPQDLSITDGAIEAVRPMWERLGGKTLHFHSIAWTRLLLPARAIGDRLLERRGRERWRRPARPLWSALDLAGRRVVRQPRARAETEELTPRALLEHLPQASSSVRLRPDYDQPFLRWLFDEMAAVTTRGTLVRRLVRRGGRVAGWYVAYLKPGGVSEAVQIAETIPRGAETVIDSLFAEASQRRSAAVEGRMEPHLFGPLSRRRCLLRVAQRALVHARDPELLRMIAFGEAMLTRMEGESWMAPDLEPFE